VLGASKTKSLGAKDGCVGEPAPPLRVDTLPVSFTAAARGGGPPLLLCVVAAGGAASE